MFCNWKEQGISSISWILTDDPSPSPVSGTFASLTHDAVSGVSNAVQSSHFLWLAAAMTFLPLAGFPVSPLWVLGGVRFGPVWGSLIALVTLAINVSLAHCLASRWLHPFIQRWLSRRGSPAPVLSSKDETKFILLVRITPGIPLVVQNYLLGCAKVNFRNYLLISLLVQSFYIIGFTTFGDALTQTKAWKLILGLCLLLSASLATHFIRKWVRRTNTKA